MVGELFVVHSNAIKGYWSTTSSVYSANTVLENANKRWVKLKVEQATRGLQEAFLSHYPNFQPK